MVLCSHPYASEVFVAAAEKLSVGVDGNRSYPSPLDSSSVLHHVNLPTSHRPRHRGLPLNLLRETAKSIEATGATINDKYLMTSEAKLRTSNR